MRLVRFSVLPAVAVLSLAACTSTVDGVASPDNPGTATSTENAENGEPGSSESTGSGGSGGSAASSSYPASLLLDETDLPEYMSLPTSDMEDFADDIAADADGDDVTIDPPECSEAFAQGSMSNTSEMLAGSTAAALVKGTTVEDIGMIMEILGPPELVEESIASLEVPEACSDVTMTSAGETIKVSMKEIPLDVGKKSAGISMTMSMPIEGEPTEITFQVGMIQEAKGALMLAVVGGDELTDITVVAYEKAHDALT